MSGTGAVHRTVISSHRVHAVISSSITYLNRIRSIVVATDTANAIDTITICAAARTDYVVTRLLYYMYFAQMLAHRGLRARFYTYNYTIYSSGCVTRY